jgi:hypothetical protein
MNLKLPESRVIEIFDRVKNLICGDFSPDKNPVIAILGGQSASGKGNMSILFEKRFPEKQFFTINGDLYRLYHPNYYYLIENEIRNYSEITQNFSNIFTRKLLDIAVKNKFNVIVEGTMRNADVPMNTAKIFRQNGFKVYACVVAAHPALTELGIYRRYNEQVIKIGVGRLADVNVHNEAVTGLLNSMNQLYQSKSVDYIHIYSYLAKKEVAKLFLEENGSWNTNLSPSGYIEQERNLQQADKKLISRHINLGIKTLKTIDSSLKNEVSICIGKLSRFLLM